MQTGLNSNYIGDTKYIDNKLRSLFCSIFSLYFSNLIIVIYNGSCNLYLGISKDKPKLNIPDNKDRLRENLV